MWELFLFSKVFVGLMFAVLMILVIWSLVWKGLALWKAARKGDKWWFIAMLVINTAGILEILYIYIFSEKKKKKEIEE